MRFILENVGKITHADVRLDGITVICGENNTGKSTIGKALFGYFASMCDIENKIKIERQEYIESFIFRYIEFDHPDEFDNMCRELREMINLLVKDGETSRENLYRILHGYPSTMTREKAAESLYAILNIPPKVFMGEYTLRYFDDIFNDTVINKNSSAAEITVILQESANTLNFNPRFCDVTLDTPVSCKAYYVNNPFALDYLNKPKYINSLGELDRNVIEAIISAKKELNANKMSNIFEAVANKEKLREVRELLKRAYKGSTVIKNDLYFYHDEEGNDIDFRSISTGLKAFALIERLLESGKLRQEDVLILDEPEIHLHPEWQMLYAELIVLLQKKFDLTILVVTHSFHFLESLKFFTEKYGIPDRGSFYMPKKTEGGYAIDEEDNTLQSLMKSLSQPVFDLSDMKFEFEMEQNHEDEDDTE